MQEGDPTMVLRRPLYHITLLLLIVPAALTAQTPPTRQATSQSSTQSSASQPALTQAPSMTPLASQVSATLAPAANAPLDVNGISALALAVHPSARAAQQHLLEAQARYAESVAQSRLQPTFTASSSGSYGRVAYPSSEQGFYTVEGLISIPIPNGKRQSGLRNQANAQLRAAQVGLDRARLDLTFRASDAYYGILRARGARDIARDNLAQAERQVKDTQQRVDAGDLATADVLKAQVPVAQARVALARAETAARVAEQTLNSLIGRDLANPLTLSPMAEPAPLTLTREQVIAQALARSPDVREAQDNLDAAQAAVQVARHVHDPDYAIQASHTVSSDITAYANLTSVMVTVNIPLGSSGVQKQQMKQAEAQLEQAKSALTLAKQQTQLAAESAILDVQSDEANVGATQETVRIAQDSLDKARLAFTSGLTTTRDVLDAQLALAQARNDANTARYDLAVALAKLDQVIGTGVKP
jgi:outer membrane protein TolC